MGVIIKEALANGRLTSRNKEPEFADKMRVLDKARVLVGTRKGAFILTSDGKRKEWQVEGPFFGGWEIYHMKGSPVDPNRIYASQADD